MAGVTGPVLGALLAGFVLDVGLVMGILLLLMQFRRPVD